MNINKDLIKKIPPNAIDLIKKKLDKQAILKKNFKDFLKRNAKNEF